MTVTRTKPRFDAADVWELLTSMLRIRLFEEKCAELYTQENIRGFLHLYDGEEAVAAGIIPLLEKQDRLVATYREDGHALARGVPMGDLLAEMYGKAEGCTGGRGGLMHLLSKDHNFYGGNAIVGGGLPMAVALALADKLQATDAVTVCFFGEDAVAEGEFHEGLNLASLWDLPVLFVCENNGYAMGTALDISEAETDISIKARGYAITSEVVDGMDVVAVAAAARRALQTIAKTSEQYFLERRTYRFQCRTYRFRAHSMVDAQLYRDKAEVAKWREKGPIVRFQEWAVKSGLLHDTDLVEIKSEVMAEIADAVAFAEAGTDEPIETLDRFVMAPERPTLPEIPKPAAWLIRRSEVP